jgi:hypothetical protein
MLTRSQLLIEANRLPTRILRARNWSTAGWTSPPTSIITKLACELMK